MGLIFCKLSQTSKDIFPSTITSMKSTGFVDADYARDLIRDRTIQLVALTSADNVADRLTKPLDKRAFQKPLRTVHA